MVNAGSNSLRGEDGQCESCGVAGSMVGVFPGEPPKEISTPQLSLALQNWEPDQLEGSTISAPSSGDNTTSAPKVALPLGFSSALLGPEGNSGVTSLVSQVTAWEFNLHQNAENSTVLSSNVTAFTIRTGGAKMAITNLSTPISIVIPGLCEDGCCCNLLLMPASTLGAVSWLVLDGVG